MTSDLSFSLERHYPATPAVLFDHVARPELMARWICPNPDLPTRCEIDLRPGGAWRCEMGTYVVLGHYVEVVPDQRLVFTWAWENDDDPATTVTITLTPDGDGTRFVLDHQETAPDVGDQGHAAGWERCLDRLAEVLVGSEVP